MCRSRAAISIAACLRSERQPIVTARGDRTLILWNARDGSQLPAALKAAANLQRQMKTILKRLDRGKKLRA
jgi:hypothetical protein